MASENPEWREIADRLAETEASGHEINSAWLTKRADYYESIGLPDLAKRYREAAHRQAESAAWLRGERRGAGVEDLGAAEETAEKTPPQTGLRATRRILSHLRQRQDQSEGLAYTLTVWPAAPRKGDIVFADVVDALRELLQPTPPMTLERACEVMTAQLFMGLKWRCTAATAYGDGVNTGIAYIEIPGYIAIAVAEKILRDAPAAPAKEVG